MGATYTDIIDAREEALENGEDVSHVVLTEDTIESFIEGAVAATSDADQVEQDDAYVGRVQSIDVEEGEKDVLVTEQNTEIQL